MGGAMLGRSALDLSGSGSGSGMVTRTLSQEIEFQRKENERTGKGGGGDEKQQKHDTLGKLPNWLRPRSADSAGRQQGHAPPHLSSSHSPTQDSRSLGKSPSSPNSSTSPGGRILSRDYRSTGIYGSYLSELSELGASGEGDESVLSERERGQRIQQEKIRIVVTDLMYSAARGRLSSCKRKVKIIEDMGIMLTDPVCCDYDRRTPLHLSCAEGSFRVTEYFLTKKKMDPNPIDRFDQTPLQGAIRGDHKMIVNLMMHHGAKIMGENNRLVQYRPTYGSFAELGKLGLSKAPSMEQLHEQNLLEDEFWEIDEDSIKKGEKLGSGEFGTVYKALWHESDVAVKVLKQSDNLALGEFVTEMNMMRKLHHPHVVQFLGGCTKTKPYFIVTELSSGGSLQEYFASKTRLPLTRELELAIDCAKGMAYLHSEGIKKPMTLHRDLKPANVMIFGNVYAHGDKARKEVLLYSGTLKITDFGLSKTLSDTGNNAYRLTGETGSYRYMAPEVYRHEDYNHKVDVYAYGMILYHLFEGRAPFNLLDPMQAAVASSKKNMRPKFSLLTKNLSSHKKLQALIETCWAADPAQRPDFVEIIPRLKECMKDMKHEMHEVKKKKWHGLFSSK